MTDQHSIMFYVFALVVGGGIGAVFGVIGTLLLIGLDDTATWKDIL